MANARSQAQYRVLVADTVKFQGFMSWFRRPALLWVCAFTAALPNAHAERKKRFEPPLLFGGGEEPPELPVETDPRLPVGAEIVTRSRPKAELPACSFRAPVCVHPTSGVAPKATVETLDALEGAYEKLVWALGLPAPLSDGGQGGGDALDLYLVTSNRTAPGFERVQAVGDARHFGGFDRASAFCVASADSGILA